MHTFRIGIVAAIVVALARPSAGDEQAAGTLRLADVLAQARSQNPAIAVARERVKAANFAPVQASVYDDPTIDFEAWNAPEPFDLDRADNKILKLSQRVPFPGKRSLAGKIAERDADVAGRRADAVELELYVTTHVPQAEQALSASEIAYQTGKLDFLSLIDSVRAIESAHLDHIEAEASFEKAFADLERAVGGPIERGGTQ